jgi:hypothetical protein
VDGLSVRVAGLLDDVDDGAAALTLSLLIAVPVSAAVLGLIVWWAVGRALRPVDAIRARVDGSPTPISTSGSPSPGPRTRSDAWLGR